MYVLIFGLYILLDLRVDSWRRNYYSLDTLNPRYRRNISIPNKNREMKAEEIEKVHNKGLSQNIPPTPKTYPRRDPLRRNIKKGSSKKTGK